MGSTTTAKRGQGDDRRLTWARVASSTVWPLTAMVAPTVGAIVAFRAWRADWNAPFRYSDDVILNLMFVRIVLTGGWGYENPRLGAPLGQQLYDYPVFSGDHLNVLLLKVLGLGGIDPALVLNLFFLLTFPLVGLTCYLVLRWLGLSAPVSAAVATLYALLPYHFLRNVTHFLLSSYYVVPLGAFLVLSLLLGKALFAPRERGNRVTRWLSWCTVRTLVLCVVIAGASGSFYYSGFTVVIATAAAVVGALAHRRWTVLASGAAVVAMILALSVASLTPTIVYHRLHGQNAANVGERQGFESEYYSVRMTQLLLPLQGHRIGAFSDVRRTYDDWGKSTGISQTEAPLATLGTLGALGFLGLLGVAAVAAVGGSLRPAPLPSALAVAVLLSLLTATMGGFSSLIGLVFPNLRAWNRLSLFIAFFSLAAVGLLLERLRRARRIRPPVFIALLGVVLTLGFLDQTYKWFVPAYGEIEAQWRNDAEFAQAIEQRLPAGAAVFELPYAEFPEGATPGGTGGYDLLRPYVHTNRLRWSSGAMRGRPADWAARLEGAPLTKVLPAVSATGFDGIYVDRLGYGDYGDRVVGRLQRLLGIRPLESRDKRFVFFDLGRFNRGLRARESDTALARLRASTLAP